MAHKPGWKHTLTWNHRRDPPAGMPRVLGTWFDREPTLADFRAVYPAYQLGCGYGHHINFPDKPRRKLADNVRIRANQRRKKTLEANRLRKHLPLLAEIIIQQEGLDWRSENY